MQLNTVLCDTRSCVKEPVLIILHSLLIVDTAVHHYRIMAENSIQYVPPHVLFGIRILQNSVLAGAPSQITLELIATLPRLPSQLGRGYSLPHFPALVTSVLGVLTTFGIPAPF